MPRIGTAQAWRDAARGFLAAGIPPDRILWDAAEAPRGLFDSLAPVPQGGALRVPRSFVEMADTVVWHADPERFARLYAFLWRLRTAPQLMADRGDPDLAHLRRMEKGVRRCKHKMKAFVRFRDIGAPGAPRRSFAAWFEPTHHTMEPTAEFFLRRFADMDWRILTPDVSAIHEGGRLRLVVDHPRPDLPDDAGEELWVTYFRNIFNPARLKVQAMQSEMPRKYWKNLPEAAAIPDLIAGAPDRARAMAEAAPSLPPLRADRVRAQWPGPAPAWQGPADALPAAIAACTRCPLHAGATQAVAGEGPRDARLMIVGEQPGDLEDLQGRPFVGPAGRLFDRVAAEAGLDRSRVFLTNAVKHFKFVARGRRRLHQRPNGAEIVHCRPWLAAELALVRPRLVLAMGATAAETLTGSGADLLARRGRVERTAEGWPVLLTLHPAYLLRQPDPVARERDTQLFRADLATASQMAQAEAD